MKRKAKKSLSSRHQNTTTTSNDETDDEQRRLLSESDTSDSGNQQQRQQRKSRSTAPTDSRQLRRMDSRVNMFAPEAHATHFEDVPVMTVCQHCRAKVVTKTGYSKSKPCCLCCCSQEILSLFNPINHTCPKCSARIAKYNRFGLSLKGSRKVYGHTEQTKQQNIAEEAAALEERNEIEGVNTDSMENKIGESDQSATSVGITSPQTIKQEKQSKKKSKKRSLKSDFR